MFEVYKRYADFQGRSGRREYWMFVLLVLLVAIASMVLVAILTAVGGKTVGSIGMLPYLLFGLASLIPSFAVTFRRLHDTDRSAWWLLIGLIPLIGSITLLVFYCLPSTPGPNRFGPVPGAAPEDLQATFA
jgi:uncharacterized membrane protein YhaH (DUF805 family)